MFGRKKKEGGTAASDTAAKEAPKQTEKKTAPSSPKEASAKQRRTVAKPDSNGVSQKNTQILYRLNHAIKQRPTQPSRSTELIPLNKEFEDMRKKLRALLAAVKKYHAALGAVSACRQEVRTYDREQRAKQGIRKLWSFFKSICLSLGTHSCSTIIPQVVNHAAKLAANTPLADAIAAKKVVLGESLVTHQDKLAAATQVATDHYQSAVVDYVTEWEAILTKKIEGEVKYTQKLQKNLQHYETKVEKLRKQQAAKEEKGKPLQPAETEKLQRNETKLKESYEEYEAVATQTSHLLDEATRQGWKDLHPLLKSLMAAEYKRETDLQAVWNLTSGMQDKVAHVVDKYDVPLPASAFAAEIVLTSRPSGADSSDDLELSDQEVE